MSLPSFDLQSQAAYSELLERLQLAELERLVDDEGSFARRTVRGNPYWYIRRRVGERINERYLGPETPELLARLETLKTRTAEAKEAARGRRGLIRRLRADGYRTTDRRSGRILEELALAGVFRLEGVLVGTHAFRCYSALLGVRIAEEFAFTGDVDIAQDATVAIGVTERSEPALGEALARAERFVEIPALDARTPATSRRTPDRGLRVDVLTPLTGKSRRTVVELPTLGVHAQALRFLDYLLVDAVPAAVLTGSGVLVRVPAPERYALHKLIVAQRRHAGGLDKMRKDLAQAGALLEALAEIRPDEVGDAWADLVSRGKGWKTPALRSLRRLPAAIGDLIAAAE